MFDDVDAEILFVEDCQHLYRRQIGGFEALDAFLREIPSRDTLVVTSWNQYAWEYLEAVRATDRTFPLVITVPSLDRDEMATSITAGLDAFPTLVDDREEGLSRVVTTETRAIDLWGGRRVQLSVPKLDLTSLRSPESAARRRAMRDLAFEYLTRSSGGNLGVAAELWERHTEDGRLDVQSLVTSRYVYVSDDRPYTVLVEERPLFRLLRGKAYVGDIRNEFLFKSDMTRRVAYEFREADIETPTYGGFTADADDDGQPFEDRSTL